MRVREYSVEASGVVQVAVRNDVGFETMSKVLSVEFRYLLQASTFHKLWAEPVSSEVLCSALSMPLLFIIAE
jgi:hypothetical protein